MNTELKILMAFIGLTILNGGVCFTCGYLAGRASVPPSPKIEQAYSLEYRPQWQPPADLNGQLNFTF